MGILNPVTAAFPDDDGNSQVVTSTNPLPVYGGEATAGTPATDPTTSDTLTEAQLLRGLLQEMINQNDETVQKFNLVLDELRTQTLILIDAYQLNVDSDSYREIARSERQTV